ncbi:hypothetical protein GALL_486540 [mine drainage metagenome]|uniref:Uncharacterized protein n=1 Tax=mine drainage metagenome TaxID=410659 RepID=A0A1J5PEE2_9ZZZZ
MDVMDEKKLLGILADQDEGDGVAFSMVPMVSTKDASAPRAMIFDRTTRAVMTKLKASGLVEEKAVVGEIVYYALSERGQTKASKRRSGRVEALRGTRDFGDVALAEPNRFAMNSVVVPAAVAAATVILLKIVGL